MRKQDGEESPSNSPGTEDAPPAAAVSETPPPAAPPAAEAAKDGSDSPKQAETQSPDGGTPPRTNQVPNEGKPF